MIYENSVKYVICSLCVYVCINVFMCVWCMCVYVCMCMYVYVFYIFEYILYVCRVLTSIHTYSSDVLAQGI